MQPIGFLLLFNLPAPSGPYADPSQPCSAGSFQLMFFLRGSDLWPGKILLTASQPHRPIPHTQTQAGTICSISPQVNNTHLDRNRPERCLQQNSYTTLTCTYTNTRAKSKQNPHTNKDGNSQHIFSCTHIGHTSAQWI